MAEKSDFIDLNFQWKKNDWHSTWKKWQKNEKIEIKSLNQFNSFQSTKFIETNFLND